MSHISQELLQALELGPKRQKLPEWLKDLLPFLDGDLDLLKDLVLCEWFMETNETKIHATGRETDFPHYSLLNERVLVVMNKRPRFSSSNLRLGSELFGPFQEQVQFLRETHLKGYLLSMLHMTKKAREALEVKHRNPKFEAHAKKMLEYFVLTVYIDVINDEPDMNIEHLKSSILWHVVKTIEQVRPKKQNFGQRVLIASQLANPVYSEENRLQIKADMAERRKGKRVEKNSS